MKKAVLFVIVLALFMPGCISRRSREDKPESALLSFFDAYSARRFSDASEMTIPFEAGTFIEMPYAPIKDIEVESTESNSTFATLSFSGNLNGKKIERWVCLYNLDGWKILNIGKNPETLRADCLNYVNEYIEPLKNGKKLELSFYDGPAENGSLFLIGEEAHYSQEMKDVEFEFVKHLNGFGYRDVFIEEGYASRYLIQRYLDTGECYDLLADEGNFIKRIYELNGELPEERKIRIWPIDVDQNSLPGLYMLGEYTGMEMQLSELYWGNEPIDWRKWHPAVIDPDREVDVLQGIESNARDARAKDIADSLMVSANINFSPAPKNSEMREERMKENFKRIFTEISEEGEVKPIVILGAGHTMKSSQKERLGFERIGYYLSDELPETKGKVCSVSIRALSGTAYSSFPQSDYLMSSKLSKTDSTLMKHDDAMIADIEGTSEREDYDFIIYLKEIHPAERPWEHD